jgi:Nucleoside-diphosphate-sugar epimerases
MRVLVTGAGGFVGRKVAAAVSSLGHELLLGLREVAKFSLDGAAYRKLDLVSSVESDYEFLSCVDVVIHTAARVHIMDDRTLDPLAAFRAVNYLGTMKLAEHCVTRGVKRFIFISSIKVNGDATPLGNPFSELDFPEPADAYGLSKFEAETALLELAEKTNMEVVIIRPPLVYGPGVKANFKYLMNWLYKGLPLPLGAIHNKRSLVYIDNLVSLITTCIAHPAAANNIFLAGDGEDLSTPDLLRRMGAALGRPAKLIPVPSWLLNLVSSAIGKSDVAQRLCGSLQVDISKSKRVLGWIPPVSVNKALKDTALAYLDEVKHQ